MKERGPFLSLLALAALGLGTSVVLLFLHGSSGGARAFASFCAVNETVNCDVVLGSPYAHFLGVPVALWAALYYVGLAGLSFGALGVGRVSTRRRLVTLILGLSVWAFLFSVYMAYVAVFVLDAVCLFCSVLYVVNALALPVAWAGFRGLSARGRVSIAWRRALAGGVAVSALLAGGVAWKGFGSGATLSADEIARAEPEFYRWYLSQPVLSLPRDGSAAGHVLGSDEAKVTIVEFSDFQCAHCARAYRVLKSVLPRYGKDVRMVFRHFPLDRACNPILRHDLHRDACLAAVAAECAGEQGHFWEYHDVLFENQTNLGRDAFLEYARRLGLDLESFRRCLRSDEARRRVEADVRAGVELGIESTPTFYLNGREVRGALDERLFRYAIVIERDGVRAGDQGRDRRDASGQGSPK